MKFKRLAEYLERIEKTSSRLKMTEILAQIFKEVWAEEIDQVVYLSLGRLRPKYEGVEFNLAEKMMGRVISTAYGLDLSKVEKEFKQVGDLGKMVESWGKGKEPKRLLSVAEVYKRLMEIAVDEGQGSQERKVKNMARLIQDLDWLSAKFVVRVPVNKLRLGFSDMTVLDGLSWMVKGNKSLRPDLERAFNVSADIGRIAAVFKKAGLKGVAGVQVKLGVPIRAALAERLPSAEKMVEKLKVFAVEPKFDGLRVQIHIDKNKSRRGKELFLFEEQKNFVRIFSRNLDNMTYMFPDIVAAAEKLPVKRAILDGEAIAFSHKTGKFLPFQETVQRKRKHGVREKAKELPIKVLVYDLLYLDGQSYLTKPFQIRRKALEKIMKGIKDGLELAEQEIVSEVGPLRQLLKKYLAQGLEGVMCKKLDTSYQAGSRNFNWVKYKKTTEGELADTIDCVVMGYYAGRGKRSSFGIGAFLVGVIDKGRIGTVAKIGTGLSDEQWRELRKKADKLRSMPKPKEYLVNKNLEPDVWVKSGMVVEIMADQITKSPIHSFALALRFPRLVRFRDDKSVDEATSRKELERLFKIQTS